MNIRKITGFTLVEIMIVLVIIGMLATIAIPAFNTVRTNSMEKTLDNELRQLAQAADQYFAEQGVTTASINDLMGTDKYLKIGTNSALGNASYPATITQGSPITISNTPIGDVSTEF